MVVWQKAHQIVLVDYLCIKTGIDGRDRIAGIKTDIDGYPCFGVPGYRLPVRGTQTGKVRIFATVPDTACLLSF
jgi:hypothetical protein